MQCPHCGQAVSDNAVFCSKCGTKVSASKSVCLECGAENDDDQVYCEQCGSKLNPPSAPPRPDPPEPVAVKCEIEGKLKRVRLFVSMPLRHAPLMVNVSLTTGTMFGVGVVDVELSADRMTVTCSKFWGSPVLFRRVFGTDPVLYSDIQSITQENKLFVFSLKSGNKLFFSANRPDAVAFFTNIQSLIETGG